jgi:hypothetical protein
MIEKFQLETVNYGTIDVYQLVRSGVRAVEIPKEYKWSTYLEYAEFINSEYPVRYLISYIEIYDIITIWLICWDIPLYRRKYTYIRHQNMQPCCIIF